MRKALPDEALTVLTADFHPHSMFRHEFEQTVATACKAFHGKMVL